MNQNKIELLIAFIENQKLAPPVYGRNNVSRLLNNALETIQRKILKYAKRGKK